MTPHQTFYLKADRVATESHQSADWVTSIEKATIFGSERPAETRGQYKDKDERYLLREEVCVLSKLRNGHGQVLCSDVLINIGGHESIPCTQCHIWRRAWTCEIKPLTQSMAHPPYVCRMRALII